MAVRLIEQWRLAILQVRLDVTRATPVVVARAEFGYREGSPNTFWQRDYHPAMFGLPGWHRRPDEHCSSRSTCARPWSVL